MNNFQKGAEPSIKAKHDQYADEHLVIQFIGSLWKIDINYISSDYKGKLEDEFKQKHSPGEWTTESCLNQ